MPRSGRSKKRLAPTYHREQKLKKRYGMDLDMYADMFAKQSGCCAICGYCSFELAKLLVVDHDHKTGRVRALLCCWCNSMLGHAKENIKVLKKAIDYIKKHR